MEAVAAAPAAPAEGSAPSSEAETVDTDTGRSDPPTPEGPGVPLEHAEPDEPEAWRVKINGQEREVTREQALKDYELRQASYERMEQAATKEKSVKLLMSRLQGATPDQFAAFMERLGHDPLAFAEAIASHYLKRAKLTPEQRELEDLRYERSRFERERAEYEQQQREQHVQAQIPVQIQRITAAYHSAMDQAGVPAAEKVRAALVQRMAIRDKQARMAGYQIPPADLLAMEWETLQEASRTYVGAVDDTRLAELVGEKRMRAARQKGLDALPDVRKFNGGKGAPASNGGGGERAFRQYSSGDLDAWRKMLDE